MVTFGTPTEQSNCKIKELWLGCVHYEPQVNTGHCMSSLHELPELLLQTAWWWRRHSAALATHSACDLQYNICCGYLSVHEPQLGAVTADVVQMSFIVFANSH